MIIIYNFKTSYVTVNRLLVINPGTNRYNFKTSYVTVNQYGRLQHRRLEQISKHLMLRLIPILSLQERL